MTVVTTASGQVRGSSVDGVWRFAGIPYAAPPVGELRFRPPTAPEAWEGVRDATAFGPVAVQTPSMMDLLSAAEPEPQDEDCLRLNVFTEGCDDGRRPVMVWIHGGGFNMGSGSTVLYNGSSFARHGVVLVTLNYRLGELGFLELGHLDPDLAGSGNNGLRDQVAALEWVRDNIAAFGGDPGNVTIFGESAGAMSVSLLMAAPAASGLFHRAVCQSGATVGACSPEIARSATDEYLGRAGVTTVEELRALTPERLVETQAAILAARMADPEAAVAGTGDVLTFLPFRPVADGDFLPLDPLAAIGAGSAAGVDLIVGSNAEEWNLFSFMETGVIDDEVLHRRLSHLQVDPARVVDAYLSDAGISDAHQLYLSGMTDGVFRIPALRLAEAQLPHGRVHKYLFSWRSPAWGGVLGAAHAMEIPFVFNQIGIPGLAVLVGESPPQELADAMHGAWIAFARDGGGGVGPRDDWPAYTLEDRFVLDFDVTPRLLADPRPESRRVWTEG